MPPKKRIKKEGWCLLTTDGKNEYQLSGIFSSYSDAKQDKITDLIVRVENKYYTPGDNFWLVRREDEKGVIYRVYSGDVPENMHNNWSDPLLLTKLF